MSEFLAMGGYGRFVWPAFVLTFAIVLLNVYAARRSFRESLADARRRMAIAKEEDTA